MTVNVETTNTPNGWMAWTVLIPGTGQVGGMSAWGDTRELALEKLQARLRDGYAPGDPKALLDGGLEAESAARCGS